MNCDEIRFQLEEKTKELDQKNQDILELLTFIKQTLIGFGVKDFSDFNGMGTKIMKGVPGILTDATIFPHRLKKRFEHMLHAETTFAKYAYFFLEEAEAQKQLPETPIKKLR